MPPERRLIYALINSGLCRSNPLLKGNRDQERLPFAAMRQLQTFESVAERTWREDPLSTPYRDGVFVGRLVPFGAMRDLYEPEHECEGSNNYIDERGVKDFDDMIIPATF